MPRAAALAAGQALSKRRTGRSSCGITMAASEMTPAHPDTEASGDLFLYSPWGLAAFEFGGRLHKSDQAFVCLGGLTDGLLSLRYLPALAKTLRPEGWRTIQPVLSSSYRGWGVGSLHEDTNELDMLLRYLRERRGVREVALLGSSTGCQDIIWYLANGKEVSMVRAAVLQAPVSDREAALVEGGCVDAGSTAQLERYSEAAAQLLMQGKGDEVLPRDAGRLIGPGEAVTAYRFHSLTCRLADDDMFSSDLTADELRDKLRHVQVPTLFVASADDEYVPAFVDKADLLRRMAAATAAGAANLCDTVVLAKGGHGLQAHAAAAEFCNVVRAFVARRVVADHMRISWEPGIAADIEDRARGRAPGRPLLVALAGMPGAGKSTSAHLLAQLLGDGCIVLGMDGFHCPLAELRARSDAEAAIYRRGAPDTFDPAALRERLMLIADPEGPGDVQWPGFDHAVGDPVPGELTFVRCKHSIVLIEGLYLLLEHGAWAGIRALFDHSIYLEADIETCIARVKERNKEIPGYTSEKIGARCETVDRANAVIVMASAECAETKVSMG